MCPRVRPEALGSPLLPLECVGRSDALRKHGGGPRVRPESLWLHSAARQSADRSTLEALCKVCGKVCSKDLQQSAPRVRPEHSEALCRLYSEVFTTHVHTQKTRHSRKQEKQTTVCCFIHKKRKATRYSRKQEKQPIKTEKSTTKSEEETKRAKSLECANLALENSLHSLLSHLILNVLIQDSFAELN